MKEAVKVLIVDDEPLARRRIERLLEQHPDMEVARSCGDGKEALKAIEEEEPDVVFLDVQMPGMTGFEVLASMGAAVPVVIFVTAYDQYALKAFDVHALDYLLKPFDEERFHEALCRARDQLRQQRGEDHAGKLMSLLEQLPAARPQEAFLQRILVKRSGRIFFVRVPDIQWIEAAGNYARLHIGKDGHLVRETMARIEARLDPGQFIRIHRSTIVNLDAIAEMRPWFSGDYLVVLKDGSELRMSRGYREKLDERIGRWF